MRHRFAVLVTVLALAGPAGADPETDPWADVDLAARLEGLSDDDPAVRRAATRALFLHAPRHPELAAPLARALDDDAPEVRLAAAQAILRLDSPPLDLLERAAGHPDGMVALRALRVLLDRDLATEAVLEDALLNPDTRVRFAALRALDGTADAVDARVAALGSLVGRGGAAATVLLERLGPAAARAAPSLVAQLDGRCVGSGATARRALVDAARRALIAIGPAAIPALLDGLEALARPIRDGRIETIARIQYRQDELRPEIEAYPDLRGVRTRYETSRAAGVPPLLRAIDGEDRALREDALRRLPACGAGSETALGALLDIVDRGAAPEVDLATKALLPLGEALVPHVARLVAVIDGTREVCRVPRQTWSVVRAPHARRAAARALAAAGAHTDLPAEYLRRLVADDDLEVADVAAGLLAPRIGEHLDLLPRLSELVTMRGVLHSGAEAALVAAGDAAVDPLLVQAPLALLRANRRRAAFANCVTLARIEPPLKRLGHGPEDEDWGGPSTWRHLLCLHVQPGDLARLRLLDIGLWNEERTARRWFAGPLGRVRDPHAPLIGGLEGVLLDPTADPDFRLGAVQSLAALAPRRPAATAALLRATKHEETRIRDVATAALADLGDAARRLLLEARRRAPSSVPPPSPVTSLADVGRIMPELASEVRRIRNNTIHRIGRAEDLPLDVVYAIAWLMVHDDELYVRLAASSALAHQRHVRAVEPELFRALRDPNLQVRRNAARALRLAGGSTEASLPVLVEALAETEDLARQTIERSPALTNPHYAHLVDRYEDEAADLRYELIGRLGWHGEEAWPALPYLPSLLGTERPGWSALSLMIGIGEKAWPQVALAIRGGHPAVVRTAADVLGRKAVLPAVLRDALAYAAREGEPKEAYACFGTLARHGALTAEDVDALVARLDADPPRSEWPFVRAVGRHGNRRHVPFLLRYLEEEPLERSALQALVALGPEAAPALDAIRARIPTAESGTLREMVRVLLAMGEAAKPAVPDLLEVLGGDSRVEPFTLLPWILDILGPDDGPAFLEAMLVDRDPERRSLALRVARVRPWTPRIGVAVDWLLRSRASRMAGMNGPSTWGPGDGW